MNTPLHPDDISRFISGRLISSLAAGQVPWRGTIPWLEAVDVSQGEHQSALRVLCTNAVTTPNICSSSG